MSGGAFEYNQRKIGYIADDIEETIRNNGEEKTIEELKDQYGYNCDQWVEKYPEDKYHYQYPAEVLKELKAAVHGLRVAEIYAQRVDWLFSGDDGPESFIKRLKEDLDELNKPVEIINDQEIIKTQQELIDLLYSQVVDLSMMSKIELGDDVIAEINRLKKIINDNQ
jgi:hypothetical protein